ncbi:MAG TPA: FAD-dependent thymidylate synthase, partial [Candidatus Eisenbacteria bacterium]|nr:FAD-dependent thymidylate synthase [Candidatus Eisenbacteria bacterium]
MPQFTAEEKAQLAKYVTDTDGDIFAVTNLPGIVGAVYARYSRAQGGFRETLLKEFIKDGNIDVVKAGDLIERVLIAFGDDSVGELEGTHVSFENVSILATKEIEDRRIGGSPIEQSTRYVFYDRRGDDGNFRYRRDPKIMASAHAQAYVGTMDFIFGTYCELVEPMKAYYEGLKPMAEAEYDVVGDGVKRTYDALVDEKHRKAFKITYNSDIRTKACDTLRALLPIATLTNVGVFGNGRFFQNVLTHCHSSPIDEVRDIAARSQAQLAKIIPRYVQRAKPNAYAAGTRSAMDALAKALFAGTAPEEAGEVELLDRGGEAIAKAIHAGRVIHAPSVEDAILSEEDNLMTALMLYPHLAHPLRQIRAVVRGLSEEKKRAIRQAYLGDRKTRRDRPGRALEGGYPYTFDLVTDFGTYKDLERHRMMTQQRQRFTPTLGFNMPEDLVRAGYADKAAVCVAKAVALYEALAPEFPEAASYATLHGSRVRWTMGINDRALMHMIELRTTPQGHPSYRRICAMMHDAVTARSAWRGAAMQFADHGDHFWSRADSEAK